LMAESTVTESRAGCSRVGRSGRQTPRQPPHCR
jgi:hypothetical protein